LKEIFRMQLCNSGCICKGASSLSELFIGSYTYSTNTTTTTPTTTDFIIIITTTPTQLRTCSCHARCPRS
jgi:hypothetical protein